MNKHSVVDYLNNKPSVPKEKKKASRSQPGNLNVQSLYHSKEAEAGSAVLGEVTKLIQSEIRRWGQLNISHSVVLTAHANSGWS